MLVGASLSDTVADAKVADKTNHRQRIKLTGLIDLLLDAVGFGDLLIQCRTVVGLRFFITDFR